MVYILLDFQSKKGKISCCGFKKEKIIEAAQREKDRLLQQTEDSRASYKQFKAKIQSTLNMYSKLFEDDDLA